MDGCAKELMLKASLQTMAGGKEPIVGVQTTMMIVKELLETGEELCLGRFISSCKIGKY